MSRLSLIFMLAASCADTAGKGQFAKGITIGAESRAHISRGSEYADSGMDEWALDEFDQAAKLRKDFTDQA